MGGTVQVADYFPTGAHQSVALGAGVVTLSVPAGADAVLMQAQTQSIYFTLDGTAPNNGASPPVGFTLLSGGGFVRIPYTADMSIKVQRAAAGAVLQWQAVRTNA